MAAHLQPDTRRGEVRIVPHLRKINTAVTSFDLQLFAVHTEHFFYTQRLFLFALLPSGWVWSVNTVHIPVESHVRFRGSVRLRGSLRPYSLSQVSFSAVRRFLSRPTCTATLAHARTPLGLTVHTPALCTTQTSHRSAPI